MGRCKYADDQGRCKPMVSATEQITKFPCPHCDQRIGVPYEMVGTTIDCPRCRGKVVVQRPAAAVSLRVAKLRRAGRGEAGPPMVARRPCPFCDEPIRVAARKCKHCGEFIDEDLDRERGGTGRSRRPTVAERVRRLCARQRRAGAMWIVVGAVQCMTVVLAVAGVWNIIRGVRARKRAERILERDASVPSELQPAWPLMLTLFMNLLFGGGVGVPVVVLDAVVRRKVIRDRQLFRRHVGNGLSHKSSRRKTPEPVVLKVPYESAFGALRDTMIDAGGTICVDDVEGGILTATWPYGSNVLGLRVTGFVRRTPDENMRVTLRGGFKEMPDTFGHARQKAFAVRDAYVGQFGDTDFVNGIGDSA